jgi:CheY-like chemotaxis protein
MPPRVLLAEDNADHAFLTRRALVDANGPGVHVDTVGDGEEALDYLHRRGRFAEQPRPHLILLDIRMPRVNGLDVLRAIKESTELRSIPTVVWSSSDRRDDIERTFGLGGNSYLTKPASPGGFRDLARELATYWLDHSQLPTPPG